MVPIQGDHQHTTLYKREHNLLLYTGAMMKDLAVEQYDLLETNQCSPNQVGTYQAKFQETSQKMPRKKAGTQQNAHHCSCLVSESTILLI